MKCGQTPFHKVKIVRSELWVRCTRLVRGFLCDRLACLITERLYSLERELWSETIISLESLVMWENFVLCLVVRGLYQDDMLRVRMDSTRVINQS